MTTVKVAVQRLTVVDALRGFALISIMLLHNVERFEVYGLPDLPLWLQQLDKVVWDSFFFLFGGKSYAIFALLFGLTFYIQTNNQEKQGKDFRLRFAGRMFWLLLFGIVNTLFYQGEILVLYALVGILLLPFARLSNRGLLVAAGILLLQPILWVRAVVALGQPDLPLVEPVYMPFYQGVGAFLKGDSLPGLMKSNLFSGRLGSLLWFWENGRITQTLGLFLVGFWAGRKGLFVATEGNLRIWRRVLLIAALAFGPLLLLKVQAAFFSASPNGVDLLGRIFGLWANLSMMAIWVSGFVLLFHKTRAGSWLNKLSPVGRMSLTNYLVQSILGASIYYGYGLALYKYSGTTTSLLVGVLLAAFQIVYSTWWFKRYKRGPLEALWHRLTWMGANKN